MQVSTCASASVRSEGVNVEVLAQILVQVRKYVGAQERKRTSVLAQVPYCASTCDSA